MKKWILASLWKLDVEDPDIDRWLERKNVPMLNYVLHKGSEQQIARVLRSANIRDIGLKTCKLNQLTGHNNRNIAIEAQNNIGRQKFYFSF